MKYANGFFVLVGIALALHVVFAEVQTLAGSSTVENYNANR